MKPTTLIQKRSSREQKLKKHNLYEIDFYFITDSSLSKKGIISDVKAAIKAGCKIVQYREKNKSKQDMINEAKKIKKICENKDVIFIVNDMVDVALAVDADGVHVGQEDESYSHARKLLGNKIIGVTVHNVQEAIEAEKTGADYVGLSPIFATSTKSDAGNPCGTAMIGKVRAKIKIPLVAIGGINKNNVAEVIKSGADAAAAISAVISSNDVQKEVSDFIWIIRNNKQ